jgi:hypothetical protein
MWDTAVEVSAPLYVCIVLVLAALYMTYNPDIHRMRQGRRIAMVALAIAAFVPIYIVVTNGSPFRDRIVIEGIAGAVLALIMYGFHEWTEAQIKEIEKKMKDD